MKEHRYHCPECGVVVQSNTKRCPVCHGQFERPSAPTPPAGICVPPAEGAGPSVAKVLTILAVFASAAIVAIAFICPSPPDPQRLKSETIDTGSIKSRMADAIREWFQKNLRDPESLEVIEESGLRRLEAGGWLTIVRYRSRNAFGGFAIESIAFEFDDAGKFVGAADLSGAER